MTKDSLFEQRTSLQNRSLHKYFELVAEQLNDAGYDVKAVLKHQVDVNWSMILVKEIIWKAAQRVSLGKSHTAELTTDEVDKIYKQVDRYTSEKFGIHQEFPHIPDHEEEIKNHFPTEKNS